MTTTIILGFIAGFWAGNGLPYYVSGSTGKGESPSPLRASAAGNVATGWVMLLIAGVCWHFAHIPDHPRYGYSAVAVGVLVVGLIHARLWHRDPWQREGGRQGRQDRAKATA